MISNNHSNVWRKLLVNFGSLTKNYGAHLDPPMWIFSGDYILALSGAAASKFYTHYNALNCVSSQTFGTRRPHVGLCATFLVLTLILLNCLLLGT